MEDCLNSSYNYLWKTDKLKRRKTETVKRTCDTWADVSLSMSGSVNSPSHSYEQKSLTPKCLNRRSLRKKQILQHTLDDKLFLEKKGPKMFPKKNKKDEKNMTTSVVNESSLLPVKGLGDVTPSKKTDGLNTNSCMNTEDFNTCSLDRSFPDDRNYCILKDKKRQKLQMPPSLKLATSEQSASRSEEFLQAVNTYSKSLCTEDTSYEDFFASSSLHENEVQVRVPEESEDLPEVCFKDSFTCMDSLDVSFCKPYSTSKKSKKKSLPANDLSVKKNFKPAEHPGSVPLNYMSDGKKADTAEAPDSDDVSRLPQNAHEKSYRTNVNYCAHTTGKSLHRAGK